MNTHVEYMEKAVIVAESRLSKPNQHSNPQLHCRSFVYLLTLSTTLHRRGNVLFYHVNTLLVAIPPPSSLPRSIIIQSRSLRSAESFSPRITLPKSMCCATFFAIAVLRPPRPNRKRGTRHLLTVLHTYITNPVPVDLATYCPGKPRCLGQFEPPDPNRAR